MLPSLRTALRRCSSSTLRSARRLTTRSFSNGGAFRSNSAPSGRVVVGIAAAAGTSYLTWRMTAGNKHVSLDAPEAPKKRKPKSPPQEPEASSSKSTSEFLQEKEEGAIKETSLDSSATSPADEVSAEGGADGEHPSQGAFNPETGEINWDCPCLGGMAYGPCGEQFREAFSCFVFSEDEPKGINCVEKFKAMQDCFREHPETYGEELAKDDEEDDYLDSDTTSSIADDSTESSSATTSSTSTQ